MKKPLSALFLVVLVVIFLSNCKNDPEPSTSPGKSYTIYTFGAYGDAGGNTYKATYWQDDKRTAISTGDEIAEINDMVVVGNDIHAVGYQNSSTSPPYLPVYWKNGVAVTIPGVVAGTKFTGIAVSGSGVYICGIVVKYPTGRGIAKYWKNGQEFTLDPREAAITTDINVFNGDVYVTGSMGPGVYWKNGTINNLPNSYNASAVLVVGNDLYIAGTGVAPGGSTAVYWKNGVVTTLSVPEVNKYESALCIAVSGGDVYIGGGLTITSSLASNLYVPKFWKNGTAVNVRDQGTAELTVRSLSVFENDVITTVSGDIFNASSYVYRNLEPIVSSSGINMRLKGHQIVTH